MCLLRPLRKIRKVLLGFSALISFIVAVTGTMFPNSLSALGWLAIDRTGLLFMWLTLIVYSAVVLHVMFDTDCVRHDHGYGEEELPVILHEEDDEAREEEMLLTDDERRNRRREIGWFCTSPFSVTCACVAISLSMMLLCTMSQHLGLLWVAIEGTTLATAPLIALHHDKRSIEATWKYLILCSVGIAVALLGNFMLAASAGHIPIVMTLDNLHTMSSMLNPVWLKAAFIFFLVGYGTKMGLVPMHSWLPDAHSEAPAPVSALLSGATLNCALLALLRVNGLMVTAGLGAYSAELMMWLGAISICVAAMFMIEQSDYKRLLAYSSVENMGIVSLAVGTQAGIGAMMHTAGHSIVKTAMFLLAGNILLRVGSTSVSAARGLARRLPWTAGFFIMGGLALAGIPPFLLFFSKFAVIFSMLSGRHPILCGVVVAGLCIAALGMLRTMFTIVFSDPPEDDATSVSPYHHVNALWRGVLVPALLLGLAALLPLLAPEALKELLHSAAQGVGLL